jgi:release factor glutamine methyltransferase
MTIFEALNWGEQELRSTIKEKSIDGHNPKIDAQVLLAHTLGRTNSYLFAHFNDPIQDKHQEKYHRFIERRMRHEPVAYILGEKAFFGRQFRVNASVLIPRPETEIMIELAMPLINEQTTVIDIGTGSGAIAITLAKETDQQVIAIDISTRALAVAKYNAQTHKVDHKISFMEGNLLEPYIQKSINESGSHRSCVIMANLPYARQRQWEFLDPDVIEYEPKSAIVSGVDGLDHYDNLLKQIQKNRHSFPTSTTLFFEIDPSQSTSIKHLVHEYFPQSDIKITNDLASKPRIVTINI